jgi:hypothetical protein
MFKPINMLKTSRLGSFWRSFQEGFTGAANFLAGPPPMREYPSDGFSADGLNIASDWRNVGQDLSKAITRFDRDPG